MRFIGIDPSTKTGFVALDKNGNILRDKQIKGIGDQDPKRMRTMIVDIMQHIQKGDVICIEGFGFASQQAVQNGGIGWGVRMALEARGYSYYEVAPNALKKFVNVTGWKGEKGSKERLGTKEKKLVVRNAIVEHYGYLQKNDNIADAFVLAQIAKAIKQGDISSLPVYQQEVIDTILNPPEKVKKLRKKVAK